jgi:hypothetical protein
VVHEGGVSGGSGKVELCMYSGCGGIKMCVNSLRFVLIVLGIFYRRGMSHLYSISEKWKKEILAIIVLLK